MIGERPVFRSWHVVQFVARGTLQPPTGSLHYKILLETFRCHVILVSFQLVFRSSGALQLVFKSSVYSVVTRLNFFLLRFLALLNLLNESKTSYIPNACFNWLHVWQTLNICAGVAELAARLTNSVHCVFGVGELAARLTNFVHSAFAWLNAFLALCVLCLPRLTGYTQEKLYIRLAYFLKLLCFFNCSFTR